METELIKELAHYETGHKEKSSFLTDFLMLKRFRKSPLQEGEVYAKTANLTARERSRDIGKARC